MRDHATVERKLFLLGSTASRYPDLNVDMARAHLESERLEALRKLGNRWVFASTRKSGRDQKAA